MRKRCARKTNEAFAQIGLTFAWQHATIRAMSILQGLLNRLNTRKQELTTVQHAPPESPTEIADRYIAEGNQAESADNLRQACDLYRKAIAAAPGYAKAHLNLGIGLEAAGEPGPAAQSYRAALAIDESDAFANYNFGKFKLSQGNATVAEALLRRALETRPAFPEARVVLAAMMSIRGDLLDAVTQLEAAVTARPEYFGALRNLSVILEKLDRRKDAEAALRRAVALEPQDAETNYDLARLLILRKDIKGAEEYLRRAISKKPDYTDAHAAMSHVFEVLGNPPAALAAMEAVVALRPAWTDAHYNLGRLRYDKRELTKAEAAFRRAIELDSTHVESIRMLGAALMRQRRLQDALDLYRAAREQCKDATALEVAELFALFCSDNITPGTLYARHVEFAQKLEALHPQRFAPFGNNPNPDRRLRIGYMSGSLHYHVVSLFLIPLMEHHDRSEFDVFCYSLSGKEDSVTHQLREHTSGWCDASEMTDAERAQAINSDKIDILIDLAGYSGVPRPVVFALRPAPVQAAWVGYLHTTGLSTMSYRISDRYCDPPDLSDRYHTEKIVRLPHSQWCYRPFVAMTHAMVSPLMRNGYVTFGSFNQSTKLSHTVLRLWSKILHRIPDARLVVAGCNQNIVEILTRDLERLNADTSRVKFLLTMSLQDYYRQYDAVDIALDTTPYGGGTTTLDALWMGVPVLTLPGERSSSRSAASILTTAGLTDWIAASEADFVARAVRYAHDTDTLVGLRRTLRLRLQNSPLMDAPKFARDMEALYKNMWRDWCAQEGKLIC